MYAGLLKHGSLKIQCRPLCQTSPEKVTQTLDTFFLPHKSSVNFPYTGQGYPLYMIKLSDKQASKNKTKTKQQKKIRVKRGGGGGGHLNPHNTYPSCILAWQCSTNIEDITK